MSNVYTFDLKPSLMHNPYTNAPIGTIDIPHLCRDIDRISMKLQTWAITCTTGEQMHVDTWAGICPSCGITCQTWRYSYSSNGVESYTAE